MRDRVEIRNNYGVVNVYVDGEDVRFGDGLQTAVKDGGEVQILPAVAGG